MLRDNKLRSLNLDPCLPTLSEGAAKPSDLPTHGWLFPQTKEVSGVEP